jgi:colanic acid biosynthesis protein WcaH
VKADTETFLKIIEYTPLVSIDLIVSDEQGRILLGFRRNRPAQNTYFVPGGRIRKNERIQDALDRISRTELGIALGKGRLLGAFNHFYDDNYINLPGLSTHYVVLAYAFKINGNAKIVNDDQHSELKWWNVEDLLSSSKVHNNTKLYFETSTDNGFQVGDATSY